MSGADLLAEFPPDQPGKVDRTIPFVERAGVEMLLVERGRAVLRLPFEPNINHVGMVYAGALFTLAEVPGGSLFASAFDMSRYYPVVGTVEIRYAKPAKSSILVDARMTDDEIERVGTEMADTGRSKYLLTHDLIDESGAVVATATGTYFGIAF